MLRVLNDDFVEAEGVDHPVKRITSFLRNRAVFERRVLVGNNANLPAWSVRRTVWRAVGANFRRRHRFVAWAERAGFGSIGARADIDVPRPGSSLRRNENLATGDRISAEFRHFAAHAPACWPARKFLAMK
jgi:hypothetical protein